MTYYLCDDKDKHQANNIIYDSERRRASFFFRCTCDSVSSAFFDNGELIHNPHTPITWLSSLSNFTKGYGIKEHKSFETLEELREYVYGLCLVEELKK